MQQSIVHLKELFAKAIELESVAERADFLNDVRRENEHLYEDLSSLLTAHDAAAGFLETRNGAEQPETGTFPERSGVGSRVGGYVLREQIGEGGMGVVFVAEKESGPRDKATKVAVKLIKPGMDSREVLTRFASEREALRLMRHPYIASVLDGGTSETGHPFFVMELVRGLPITEYCERHKLGLNERLELFEKVCAAVQHAHLKGIIHRDLKPANVLVEHRSDGPVPKVIDFGVAKALDQRLTNDTVYTRFAALIGTPQYMSPEQTQIPSLDVDTRSDIYSLGVILYELVAGELPFDDHLFRTVGLEELLHRVRTQTPLRPSVRRARPRDRDAVNPQSPTNPARMSPPIRIPREVDWIVMKALEKEPGRRYQSAIQFSEDLQNFLAGRPVAAGPPSGVYQLQKYLRRHWRLLATSILVVATAAVGAVVSLKYAADATQLANKANQHAKEADESRRTAEASNLQMRKLLYAGDMAAAARFFQQGDLRSCSEILNRYEEPESSQADLRGFEWWYLRHRIEIDSRLVAQRDEQACLVRFSPDGRWLVIGWTDGVVEVRDGTSRHVHLTLRGHGDFVNGCDFHPTEEILATIADSGTVRLWNLQDGQLIREIQVCERHAHRVFFSPDGDTLLTSAEEGGVRYWNTSTGASTGDIDGLRNVKHESVKRSLACSPDRTTLAVGGAIGSAYLFDAITREEICPLEGVSGDVVHTFRFSSDGRILAGAMRSTRVLLWSTIDGKLLDTFEGHLEMVHDLAFDPSGQVLLSCDRGGIVRSWSLRQLIPEFQKDRSTSTVRVNDNRVAGFESEKRQWPDAFRAHSDRVLSLDIAPDGQRMVTGSRDKRALEWREHHIDTHSMPVDQIVESATFLADGQQLLVATESYLEVWHLATGERRIVSRVEVPALKMQLLGAGPNVVTSHTEGWLRLWNSTTWRPIAAKQFQDVHVRYTSSDTSGTILAVINATLHEISFLKLPPEKDFEPYLTLQGFHDVWIAPDGKSAIATRLNDLCVVSPQTGEVLQTLVGHLDSALHVVFSNDSRRIASVSTDRTIRIWDLTTGQCEHVVYAHDDPIKVAALSPDGRTLVSGDAGGVLVFTHFDTGRVMMKLPIGQEAVKDLDFSPDGSSLVVVQRDKVTVLKGARHEASESARDEEHRQAIGEFDATYALSRFGPVQPITGSVDSIRAEWERDYPSYSEFAVDHPELAVDVSTHFLLTDPPVDPDNEPVHLRIVSWTRRKGIDELESFWRFAVGLRKKLQPGEWIALESAKRRDWFLFHHDLPSERIAVLQQRADEFEVVAGRTPHTIRLRRLAPDSNGEFLSCSGDARRPEIVSFRSDASLLDDEFLVWYQSDNMILLEHAGLRWSYLNIRGGDVSNWHHLLLDGLRKRGGEDHWLIHRR